MVVLILDALVLMGLVMMLQSSSEGPGFLKALLVGLGIGVVTFAAAMGLASLGLLGLALIFIAAAAIAGIALWVAFDVDPVKAAIGGGLFLAYKIVLGVTFAIAFGG